MYNWSIDEKKFKKEDPKRYKIWRLEQSINYGEPGEKLQKQELKKYWDFIRDNIDPSYRLFLEFLLWPKKKKTKAY